MNILIWGSYMRKIVAMKKVSLEEKKDWLRVVASGDVEEMKEVLGRGRIKVDDQDEKGMSALHVAASVNNAETGKFLIAQGANVHLLATVKEKNALHMAATKPNSREMCELLVKAGVDLAQTDVDGHNALHFAANFGRSELIDVFRDGAGFLSALAQTNSSGSVLHYALVQKSTDFLLKLLECVTDREIGGIINSEDMLGRRPLHLVSLLGDLELFLDIKSRGAALRALDSKGKSAKDYAGEVLIGRMEENDGTVENDGLEEFREVFELLVDYEKGDFKRAIMTSEERKKERQGFVSASCY
jgi:ankyrin repeat protein